jgi:hypothetical protein
MVKDFEDFLMTEADGHHCITEGVNHGRHLSMPSTTAFTDFDGDCIPDLLLITKDPVRNEDFIEIYHQVSKDPKLPLDL